ncbi:MAG: ADP-glyceromanno-heptose 6-epimerase [Deltaproteobacteria bacterium]|nr:ADP-glyceromanno-heptose 6-epimerase [Deltaproteobacteria bacterium]
MKTQNPILITGALGFIGARFVESCNRRNIETLCVDLEEDSRKEHQGIHFGKIIEPEDLFKWLNTNKPALQAIVHLGACTNTMELNENFLTKVNLEYSKKIWTYASDNKIPLVYASSAATYGAGELGYDDDEKIIPKLKPLNPYGQSKQLFDLWALEQEQRGSTPPTWSGFKFFNVYGFGERHKGAMASVVLHAYDQISESGYLKLFKSHKEGVADGHQKRDFVFIEDVTHVLHFALEKPIQRGIFNLGTGKARTFLDLANATFAAMKKPVKIIYIDTPEVLRPRYQYFTEAKMDRLIKEGYTTPFTSLEKGVDIYSAELSKQVY